MKELMRILSGLWEGWKKVGHAIGRCVTAVLLTIFWIVCIGLYALVLNIVRLGRKKRSVTWQPSHTTSAAEMADAF